MNYEDCLHDTVQESVVDLLKRLPELDPLDRWALLVEHIEDVADEWDIDDVLMVPNFDKGIY